MITLGETSSVEIEAEVRNAAEDSSYQTTMIISIPTGRLVVGRVSGILNSVS